MAFGDEHLKALGRITVEFSSLESVLDVVIAILIGHEFDEVGLMIAAQLSFARKTDLIDSLVRHKFSDKELVNTVREVLGEAIRAESEATTAVNAFKLDVTHTGLCRRIQRFRIKRIYCQR